MNARTSESASGVGIGPTVSTPVSLWQPIETAPRDGTPIIGGYFNQPWAESHREGDIVRCWYQPEFEAFISSCREMRMHNGWTFGDGSTRSLHSPVIEAVTHWQPLPAPPVIPANQGQVSEHRSAS